ncbi:MAG TPA: hypothetical protein VEC36_12500 [Patescibacteria group bacterium]|nr:hypothetical protein [Patescibacteria group bacterium]
MAENSLKTNADIHCFSHENLVKQTETAEQQLGYYIVHFYVDEAGVISKEKTDIIGQFFLSPSGGTLRDKDMNIVTYSAKYDKYKGYGKA